MSAQVQLAKDAKKKSDWDGGEVTPVIIKTGGGPDVRPPKGTPPHRHVPEPRVQCTITAEGKDFESARENGRWGSAKSVQTASIVEVAITDNGVPVLPPFTANSPGLVVLQITYGPETLIVQETEIQGNSDLTNLLISSSHLFSAANDKWSESSSTVPADFPLVVFTYGGESKTYQCESNNVTITVSVEWN